MSTGRSLRSVTEGLFRIVIAVEYLFRSRFSLYIGFLLVLCGNSSTRTRIFRRLTKTTDRTLAISDMSLVRYTGRVKLSRNTRG